MARSQRPQGLEHSLAPEWPSAGDPPTRAGSTGGAQLCGYPGEDAISSASERALCVAKERSACPGGTLSPSPDPSDAVVPMGDSSQQEPAWDCPGQRAPHPHTLRELGKVCALLPCIQLGGLA